MVFGTTFFFRKCFRLENSSEICHVGVISLAFSLNWSNDYKRDTKCMASLKDFYGPYLRNVSIRDRTNGPLIYQTLMR